MVFSIKKKIKNNYVFNSQGASFINFDVILHFATFWPGGIMCIYAYFVYHQIVLLFISAFFLLHPSTLEYLYYRRILFKYNKTTKLVIDSQQRVFTYTHDDKVVSFCANEIERWHWNKYTSPYFTTFVEIIEFELKNREKLIISSGIGQGDSVDLSDFFSTYRKEIGLPEGEHNFKFDLHSYIKEIAE